MARTSPTQRSLARLKKTGCAPVAIVERWNPHAFIRQDLFGCIDILGIRTDPECAGGIAETIAIQACADDGVSKRVAKLRENPALYAMLCAKWTVEVWGWSVRRGTEKTAKGLRTKREVAYCRRVAFRLVVTDDRADIVEVDPDKEPAPF